ncbi:DUF6892 domain-containing protein [Streptomyces xanthophaeus]|uniref:DUF6892 domain-containing protein n=1 Tax=Streptomyces xanthophaeus TaxID=67385 RepID=UPI000691217E|nr:hypothetical protein [Streptomyces xanthophaeus]
MSPLNIEVRDTPTGPVGLGRRCLGRRTDQARCQLPPVVLRQAGTGLRHPLFGNCPSAFYEPTFRAPLPGELDAGADVFRHCAHAWDGEDDLFDVRSLDDLALLFNLREVTFVEDGVLAVPDAAETFSARGIDTD